MTFYPSLYECTIINQPFPLKIMEQVKKKAIEKLENLYDIYGLNTGEYFQSKLVKIIFILQNTTPKEVTKEQITEVSTALEELYNVFELPTEYLSNKKKQQYEHRHKMTA